MYTEGTRHISTATTAVAQYFFRIVRLVDQEMPKATSNPGHQRSKAQMIPNPIRKMASEIL